MKLKLTLSYDGTNFYGSQRQKYFRTVQGELEKAIGTIEQKEITIKTAGRTDRGVHATGQVAAFDSQRLMTPEKYRKALNPLLPKDIFVGKIEQVPDDFDPRRDALRRDYLYRIKIGSYNPLLADHALQIERIPDVGAMERAAQLFVGTHDFRPFSVGNDKSSYTTVVFDSQIRLAGSWIYYKISAAAFFRHMVRRIVRLLIETGCNRYAPDIVLESLSRKVSYFSAVDACGLILRRVSYD